MGSMLLEIFPVSPRGFESFARRFGSPFGAIFKRGGRMVYVFLASLPRVRFGECLLSEFLSCLLAATVSVSTVPSFFETVAAETSAAKL